MRIKRSLSLYWKCQIIGWSVTGLYWGYAGYHVTNFSFALAVIYFFTDLFLYILITHLYRLVSLKMGWEHLPPNQLFIRIIPAVIILGITYLTVTSLKTFAINSFMMTGHPGSYGRFLKATWLQMFMAGIRLMSIWVLAYYLYHFAQRELTTVKENARLAIIAKDAQIDNLANQLNPHFFFNSLNNIKALVIEDPASARRAIDLLSDLLRTSLNLRDQILIPIREEIELIRDYIELEKMRFEERLQASIELDSLLEDQLILPLSIQGLVENAIKHGISQKKNGGTVYIKIEREEWFIKITVKSPGKINHENQGSGFGLRNFRERLGLLYNGKAAFYLTCLQDDTVLASILIPIE